MVAYFCYIVECADGTYYTGWSTDPVRRTRVHNSGRGAKYTRQHGPVRLVYVEPQPDRSQAMKREIAIKGYTRARKERLIQTAADLASQEENHNLSGQNLKPESL